MHAYVYQHSPEQSLHVFLCVVDVRIDHVVTRDHNSDFPSIRCVCAEPIKQTLFWRKGNRQSTIFMLTTSIINTIKNANYDSVNTSNNM